MKRWKAAAVAGFLVFVVYSAPEGSAGQAREYGAFLLEGAGSVAEFADTLFDRTAAATSQAG